MTRVTLTTILYVEDEPYVQAVSRPALDAIAKPFDPMRIAGRIRSTGDRRHG